VMKLTAYLESAANAPVQRLTHAILGGAGGRHRWLLVKSQRARLASVASDASSAGMNISTRRTPSLVDGPRETSPAFA
jgi:hypothetical protein